MGSIPILNEFELARRSRVLVHLEENAFGLCAHGFVDGSEQFEELLRVLGRNSDTNMYGYSGARHCENESGLENPQITLA